MTVATQILYTRSIQIDEQWFRLQPGDQVDNLGDWCTVARLGEHAEDKDVEDAPDDSYCDGDGCPVKKSKELKACRRAISRARADESMYQRAADNSPDEAVRSFNQRRANWAGEAADTYERWLGAQR